MCSHIIAFVYCNVGLLPTRRAHPKVGVTGGARSRTSNICLNVIGAMVFLDTKILNFWSNGCATIVTFTKWTFVHVYVHERSKFGCEWRKMDVHEKLKSSQCLKLRHHPISGCFLRTCNSFYNSKFRATPARMCNSVNIQFLGVIGERATLSTMKVWMYFLSIDVQFWRLFSVTTGVDGTRTVKAFKNHKKV